MYKIRLFGFDIYKKWYSNFPFDKPSIYYNYSHDIMEPEIRIKQLAERVDLKRTRILELGCLEGAHTLMLQELGVREIVAIEGREENFLKCLILKNAFKLNNCQFLYGDINKVLEIIRGPFDICLALGILYHLKNPAHILYRISELADKLFVWTHFATKDSPKGKLIEINYSGNIYKGKYVAENTDDCHASLEKQSFWLLEKDMFSLVSNAGFKNIELIAKENHRHKPALCFLASK